MTELFSHIQKKSLDYSNLSNQDLHKKYYLELTSVRSQSFNPPKQPTHFLYNPLNSDFARAKMQKTFLRLSVKINTNLFLVKAEVVSGELSVSHQVFSFVISGDKDITHSFL